MRDSEWNWMRTGPSSVAAGLTDSIIGSLVWYSSGDSEPACLLPSMNEAVVGNL